VVNPQKAVFFFRSTFELNRRVKAGRPTEPGREDQRQAFTPAVILFIAFSDAGEKTVPG
jgi:hypothetical protein